MSRQSLSMVNPLNKSGLVEGGRQGPLSLPLNIISSESGRTFQSYCQLFFQKKRPLYHFWYKSLIVVALNLMTLPVKCRAFSIVSVYLQHNEFLGCIA